MNIDQFCHLHPEYCFDFGRPLKEQRRVYAADVLAHLPDTLEPWVNPPVYRGRGAVNVNQTLAHYQCVSCNRVLRNDSFHLPPSFVARNRVFSYCKSCYVTLNADAYDIRTETVESRRRIIWSYLAPRCILCGFDKHPSAMDLHHSNNEQESAVFDLIIRTSLAPTAHNVSQLLQQASECAPLCANCHRLLHAGILRDARSKPPHYTLAGFMHALQGAN
jgi:hypothetical protein